MDYVYLGAAIVIICFGLIEHYFFDPLPCSATKPDKGFWKKTDYYLSCFGNSRYSWIFKVFVVIAVLVLMLYPDQ
ncbi:MAG: hypothetical protein AAB766_01100 [Patescibacteria group bacterium]